MTLERNREDDKAGSIADATAKGSTILFAAITVSTVISAAGSIIVASLLSSSEYGLVTVAWVLPGLAVYFRDWGVNSAIIANVARHCVNDRRHDISRVITGGTLFTTAIGAVLSVTIFALSDVLASDVFGRPEARTLIQVASLTLLCGGLTISLQSALIGLDRMKYYGLALATQAILTASLSSAFVVLGWGPLGAVSGTTIALLCTGAVCVHMVRCSLHSDGDTSKREWRDYLESIPGLLRFGVPLSISGILTGVASMSYMFLMVIYVQDSLVGSYQVALNLVILITFFYGPFNTVLFPAFSKLTDCTDVDRLRSFFTSSVRMASLFVVGASIGLVVVSEQAILMIFGDKYQSAYVFFSLLAIPYLLTAFGSVSINNLLKGGGRTKAILGITVISVGFGVPFGLTLIPAYGVIGLITTNIMSSMPFLALGLWYVTTRFGVRLDLRASLGVIIAACTAGITSSCATRLLSQDYWIEASIGLGVFLAVYVSMLPILGAVRCYDLAVLEDISDNFGILSRPTRSFTKILRIIMRNVPQK